MPSSDRTFLFLHVMKTGGTSFLAHLLDIFPVEAVYPEDQTDRFEGRHYGSLTKLTSLTDEERSRYRAYAGHLPHLVRDVIRPDVTMTILRHPVDRAVSMLRQIQAVADPGSPLERIYDENPSRWTMIQDYQSRQFALSMEELVEADRTAAEFFPSHAGAALEIPHLAYVPMDEVRLERAVEAASSVDVVGLQSHYDLFLASLEHRYGWRFDNTYRRRVARRQDPVAESFRRRIADDNALDVEFYERVSAMILNA